MPGPPAASNSSASPTEPDERGSGAAEWAPLRRRSGAARAPRALLRRRWGAPLARARGTRSWRSPDAEAARLGATRGRRSGAAGAPEVRHRHPPRFRRRGGRGDPTSAVNMPRRWEGVAAAPRPVPHVLGVWGGRDRREDWGVTSGSGTTERGEQCLSPPVFFLRRLAMAWAEAGCHLGAAAKSCTFASGWQKARTCTKQRTPPYSGTTPRDPAHGRNKTCRKMYTCSWQST